MRPQGEVRQALAQSAQALFEERGAFNFRDLATHANVGFGAARCTVQNMARTGDLVRVGAQRLENTRAWIALYEPGEAPAVAQADAVDDLLAVTASWATFA